MFNISQIFLYRPKCGWP